MPDPLPIDPPQAERRAHTWTRPNARVDDPWAWLRDRDDPATIAYLEAENRASEAWFAEHGALVEEIFEEIKGRVQETDTSPPVRRGEWWYSSRTEQGASYPLHCRGSSPDVTTHDVILDENAEARGHDYFSLSAFDLDEPQRLLAWSCDVDGSEHYTLRVRDLASGHDLDDVITGTTWAGTAWSADSEHLFYVRDDAQQRPYQVCRHRLGTPEIDDVVVFEDLDERFFVNVELSRSGRWILIESHSRQTSEALVLPADQPTAAPRLVRPRTDDVEYSVEHWNDRFVVVTNLEHPDFSVMTAPLDAPERWTTLVAGADGRRITAAEPFAGHLVLHEWADAQPRLRVIRTGGSSEVLDLGVEPHDVELDVNPEYETSELRYAYQSLTSPPSIYSHDLASGRRELLKQTAVLGTDLNRYRAERVWATAPDGTRLPVDIVWNSDTAVRPSPTVVYGYGSYEVSMAPWFSHARLSLLDRGVVFALVHPRGGGEFGRGWYLDGKLLNKANTFTDTIACAEHLVDAGIASPGALAVRGGSAGGLLVGACVTMRPELFRAAVAEVPFVDVVTTMSDPSLPLTVTEWEEWGDPRAEPFASYIAGYSPYDNTVAADYPALYVTAGLNDPRVSFHEPAKWIAKLRAMRTNDAPLLMRCEMSAGHGGPSGRYDAWRDEARVLTFLLVTLPAG